MICKVKNCTGIHVAKGYCEKHYRQFKKYGKILKTTKRDFNEVIDKGLYVELVLTNLKAEEIGRTKIDKEDLEKVKLIGRWSLRPDGYVVNAHGGKTTRLHRLVIGAKDGELVDHKKAGSTLDNRKKNLRLSTHSQNMYNQRTSKRNKSGHKGVSWNKNTNKWIATTSKEKKPVWIGAFTSKEDAIVAHIKATKKLHGEFYRKE